MFRIRLTFNFFGDTCGSMYFVFFPKTRSGSILQRVGTALLSLWVDPAIDPRCTPHWTTDLFLLASSCKEKFFGLLRLPKFGLYTKAHHSRIIAPPSKRQARSSSKIRSEIWTSAFTQAMLVCTSAGSAAWWDSNTVQLPDRFSKAIWNRRERDVKNSFRGVKAQLRYIKFLNRRSWLKKSFQKGSSDRFPNYGWAISYSWCPALPTKAR